MIFIELFIRLLLIGESILTLARQQRQVILIEGKYGSGAKPIHPLWRKVVKFFRPKIAEASIAFDWATGYDVRDTIGAIKIKDQGTSSSCSGQAGAYFLEIQGKLRKVKEEISAKSIYGKIFYPGGGSTVTSLINQIAIKGALPESEVPSYKNGIPLSEAMMIENSWTSSVRDQEAYTRAGYTPFDIGEGIDEVAQVIKDWGAVIIEIQGKNNGTWLSSYPKPPEKDNPNALWTHFMCCIGSCIINGQKTIIALQSWGDVGAGGVQFIQEDYFKSGYVLDAFTLCHNSRIQPKKENISIWAEILRAWHLDRLIRKNKV